MTFHGAYSTMFIRRRQVDPRAERRSGNNGTTYLMASVKKAGTVSFWWKAQCETLANFLDAAGARDDARLASEAQKLIEYRIANRDVLDDFYGMNMAGNWNGLENRIWPNTGLLVQ